MESLNSNPMLWFTSYCHIILVTQLEWIDVKLSLAVMVGMGKL
jgi:hypothetical protein